jgi:hypothetical protein
VTVSIGPGQLHGANESRKRLPDPVRNFLFFILCGSTMLYT